MVEITIGTILYHIVNIIIFTWLILLGTVKPVYQKYKFITNHKAIRIILAIIGFLLLLYNLYSIFYIVFIQ